MSIRIDEHEPIFSLNTIKCLLLINEPKLIHWALYNLRDIVSETQTLAECKEQNIEDVEKRCKMLIERFRTTTTSFYRKTDMESSNELIRLAVNVFESAVNELLKFIKSNN